MTSRPRRQKTKFTFTMLYNNNIHIDSSKNVVKIFKKEDHQALLKAKYCPPYLTMVKYPKIGSWDLDV